MRYALVAFAALLAVSSGVFAEPTDKDQPPAARQKQSKKRAAATEAKPKAEQTAPGGMPQSFVIPSNTCEQGTPLQKLLTDKPRESK